MPGCQMKFDEFGLLDILLRHFIDDAGLLVLLASKSFHFSVLLEDAGLPNGI